MTFTCLTHEVQLFIVVGREYSLYACILHLSVTMSAQVHQFVITSFVVIISIFVSSEIILLTSWIGT